MNTSLLRLQRIRGAFAKQPLAILQDEVAGIIAAVRGTDFSEISAEQFLGDARAEDVEAYYELRAATGGARAGTVAVVPVLGPISKRDSMFSMMLGGTSTSRLSAQLRQLAADDSIATILLDVDSPGGTISGLPELAADIRRVREQKPVVAISNDLAASAAYWIASQADTIIATPESLTGSIGVFTQHTDCSGYNEQNGMKVTYIYAGQYKVEGNPDEPLSDDAKAYIQSLIDSAYGMFVGDVAQGRGITTAKVKADFGEGRVLTAKDARAVGMVDRIATYNDTIARLSGVKVGGTRSEALGEVFAAIGVKDPVEGELADAMAEREQHAEAEAEFNAKLAATRSRTARWRIASL